MRREMVVDKELCVIKGRGEGHKGYRIMVKSKNVWC